MGWKKEMLAAPSGGGTQWITWFDGEISGVNADSGFYNMGHNTMPNAPDYTGSGEVLLTNSFRADAIPKQVVGVNTINLTTGDLDWQSYWRPNNENQGSGGWTDGTNKYWLSVGGYSSYYAMLCKFNSSGTLVTALENNAGYQGSSGPQLGAMNISNGNVFWATGGTSSYQHFFIANGGDTTSYTVGGATRSPPSPWRRSGGSTRVYAPQNDPDYFYVTYLVDYGPPQHIMLGKYAWSNMANSWERKLTVYTTSYTYPYKDACPVVYTDGSMRLIEVAGSNYNLDTKAYYSSLVPSTGAPSTGNNNKTQITYSGWSTNSQYASGSTSLSCWADSSDNTYITFHVQGNSGSLNDRNYIYVSRYDSNMNLDYAYRVTSWYYNSTSDYIFVYSNGAGRCQPYTTDNSILIPIPIQIRQPTAPTELNCQCLLKVSADGIAAGNYGSWLKIDDITSSVGTASATEGANDNDPGFWSGSVNSYSDRSNSWSNNDLITVTWGRETTEDL